MHKSKTYGTYCITLSGGQYACRDSTTPAPCLPIHKTALLDDRTACRRNGILHSVRRFLSKTGYYSSFTHNGKWYTLRTTPRFSRDGLWFYRDIGFSRASSLTNTLFDLTSCSPAGMTAEMLGEKLRCRCHTILVQLYRRGKLQRKKAGRSYVYLAADPHAAAVQCRTMALKDLPPAPLPAETAVLALVAFIRNPQASFKKLAKTLSTTRNVTVDAVQIERFDLYGLKKTT